MNDGMLRLALAIHSGRGLYALMVGSGVSRAASMPTGWEVVLDLVRQVAAVRGEEPAPDPAAWYEETVGAAPDYTDLLDQLSSTPAERGMLLRGYFEPTEEERERREKQPTAAHRAIARLMRDGYINVVVTTNFDRLLEQALVDEGVQPTVISSADDIAGAPPLSHARALIVKVHGDYLDGRVRNTRDELSSYEPEMESLLARIFGDFGLVVAGWSGAYDTALREVIEKTPNPQYGTYWAARGSLEESAEGVVENRSGQVIQINDADSFFTNLEEQVRALDRMAGGVALTAAVASSRVKRYVVDDRHRIDLHDPATEEVERVVGELSASRFPVSRPEAQITEEAFLGRLAEYEALTEKALAIISTGARWGEPDHANVWVMMIDRLLNADYERGGLTVWINLQFYPPLRLLYGAGIAALAGGHEELLPQLLNEPKRRDVQPNEPAHQLLAVNVLEHDFMKQAYRPSETETYKTPTSQYMFDRLREPLRGLVPDDAAYEQHFDRFEYLTALIQNHHMGWFQVGRHAWRGRHYGPTIAGTVDEELERQGSEWPLLAVGEFRGDMERLREVKDDVDERARSSVR